MHTGLILLIIARWKEGLALSSWGPQAFDSQAPKKGKLFTTWQALSPGCWAQSSVVGPGQALLPGPAGTRAACWSGRLLHLVVLPLSVSLLFLAKDY